RRALRRHRPRIVRHRRAVRAVGTDHDPLGPASHARAARPARWRAQRRVNAQPATHAVAAGSSEARALAFLADLSQALAVSLDLRETLDEAINRIADFMGAEAASLF